MDKNEEILKEINEECCYVLFYDNGNDEHPFFSIKLRNEKEFIKNYVKQKDISIEILTEKEFKELEELENE